MDDVLLWNIKGELAWGASLADIMEKHSLSLEQVEEIVRHIPQASSKEVRRALALMRIDALSEKLMSAGKTGDVGAIRTWIELQKREAALTGMDAVEKKDVDVRVSVDWLQPGRLAYKESDTVGTDIRRIGSGSQEVEDAKLLPHKDQDT